MKIVEINVVPHGSTGKIAKSIATLASKKNETYFAYSWTKNRKRKVNKNEILIGSFLGKSIHILLSILTGYELSFSWIDTLLFIKKLKKIKPDIIHLHIMHSWYINIPILFKYIKKNNIQVIWTFHDGWALTGHCACFDYINCNKWQSKCHNCPLYKEYPKCIFDNTKIMFPFKKKWFSYLEKMIIVTPSEWLANKVKISYLNKYRIMTINNGIDLSIFKKRKSNFRKDYGLEDKFVLLGVSLDWTIRKGIDIFNDLAEILPDDYQIVLVGTNEKNKKEISKKIIAIDKTDNQIELSKIYSNSDLFINPTRDDNFPTVNMEALACGLPIITFNTGGSPEIIDEKSGIIIEKNNIDQLVKTINKVKNKEIILKSDDCIKRAKKFNNEIAYMEYIKLFDSLK